MDADHYSRPERAAEIYSARKVIKRINAARGKHGNCCICVHREETFGVLHCRNKMDRQRGQCEADGKWPKFKFDDESIEVFRDKRDG